MLVRLEEKPDVETRCRLRHGAVQRSHPAKRTLLRPHLLHNLRIGPHVLAGCDKVWKEVRVRLYLKAGGIPRPSRPVGRSPDAVAAWEMEKPLQIGCYVPKPLSAPRQISMPVSPLGL
jgi:hypothetical protein